MSNGRPRALLAFELVQEIKRMYEERRAGGRRRYTQMEIAKLLGLGETTVYRAIKSMGAYHAAPEPVSEADMLARSKASLARMLLMQGQPVPDAPAVVEIAQENLMDRLAADIARRKAEEPDPDQLTKELKESK